MRLNVTSKNINFNHYIMKYNTKVVFLFFIFISFSFSIFSENSKIVNLEKANVKTTNMTVVNIDKISSKAFVVKNIESQIEAIVHKNQLEMLNKEKKFKKLEQELIAKKGTINTSSFEKEVMALNELSRKLQQDNQRLKASLDKSIRSAKEKLNNEIDSIIRELAIAKNISFVISSNHSLYYAPNFDMTDEVLNKLNSNLKTIDLKEFASNP